MVSKNVSDSGVQTAKYPQGKFKLVKPLCANHFQLAE